MYVLKKSIRSGVLRFHRLCFIPTGDTTPSFQNLADTESMLLVEFAGETGHGTGPTLEVGINSKTVLVT